VSLSASHSKEEAHTTHVLDGISCRHCQLLKSSRGGVGQARELAEGRDYDYEPGGRGQVFGVRLVRGLPTRRSRAAGTCGGEVVPTTKLAMDGKAAEGWEGESGGSGSSLT